MKHIGSGGKYLYPVKQLSLVFRTKLMSVIKETIKKQGLAQKHQSLLDQAWAKPWTVFCEPSMANADHVVRYLGQYTHRVAITNQRIIEVGDRTVTFMHKDYADGARQKPITLDGLEFLRRFCLHILPYRFVKIRHYGIYSSRHRSDQKKLNPKMEVPQKPKESTTDRIKRLTGFDVYRCPCCETGTMHTVEILPKIRSPAPFYPLISARK